MITIRRATGQDVSYLQALNNEVFVDNQQYDSDPQVGWSLTDEAKGYYTSMARDADALCLIAEENGKRIGYLAGSKKEEVGRKSRYLEVNDMGVSPAYRSKGVGRMLLDECFKIAKEKGFDRVFVRVYFDNAKAIGFYKNSGFKEIELGLERAL
ncbi:MAG TPA: GNAT family N-acetyltransferase [Candidatus Paceibacterota bacterium]|nr:GNAT family N-acetyltransferase [Candidatus Paceibacterota bacterium]